MSPEQAKGRVVDKRADIWAFGCVLYEMMTGRRAFDGDDVSDTLAGILRGEPDWSRLPDDVPRRLPAVLRRCLEKDPRARIRDIGDVRLAMEGGFDIPGPAAAVASTGGWGRERLAGIVAGVLAIAAMTGLAPYRTSARPRQHPRCGWTSTHPEHPNRCLSSSPRTGRGSRSWHPAMGNPGCGCGRLMP